ncbi:Outer membrane protein A precursor [Collimonas arenae]|uniref:Outer membrane protein A n=1 Tax=Collimonas arenae TaxID=279058 RepID=A0A0A1FDD7_9BURK|nr:OmpA family protein [Collimonas arenae]AIY41689.1 Outer membrane protein A precursor [Collimonas arenae]
MNNKIIGLLGGMCLAFASINALAADDGTVKFPDADSASLKEGTFVNIDNLRQVIPGLSKNQMYALLQEPHFSEGVFGVRQWNYIFNFRTGKGYEFVRCQYQVQFDDHKLVKATYWKDPACADFLKQPAAPEAVAAPVALAAGQEKFALSVDTLFPFAKSSLDTILPSGRTALGDLAAKIKSRYVSLSKIVVTGYADRIGSPESNQTLSLARAATVRDYLVGQGIEPGAFSVQGLGASQPITQCETGRTAAVINCLQPDRRVTIDVSGEKR